MRGDQFNYDDPSVGLPSVPKRRPDLLGNLDTLSRGEPSNEAEYAYITNDKIQDHGGMDGWMRYLGDIQNNRIITAGLIVKMEGNIRKQANTKNWTVDEQEIEKLEYIMRDRDMNIPCRVQNSEYHIMSNDGQVASASTIGSRQEPKVMTIGKTKGFLIVGVADGNLDQGQCQKEIMWITDHIQNEGY